MEFGNLAGDGFNDYAPQYDDVDDLEKAAQGITIAGVVEKKAVHFTVLKDAAQTLAVSGADAAKVTLTTTGGIPGSSTQASPGTAIVSVDLDDFDTQFEGRAYEFVLTVAEEEKSNKTYTIRMDATPDFTGAAVFVVDRSDGAGDGVKDGKLTRITAENMGNYITASLSGAENTAASAVGLAEVDKLENALIWVDHNAKQDTEYLIRVEHNEALVRHNLSCMKQENVIVRLRGAGAERLLTFDRIRGEANPVVLTIMNKSAPISGTGGLTKFGEGWINIGYNTNTNKITLQIEKNITLDFEDEIMPTNSTSNLAGIFIKQNSVFIMEEGSKITRYKPFAGGGQPMACIIGSRSAANVWIKGGEITDSNLDSTPYGFIFLEGANNSFKKTGGTFSNNTHTKLCFSSSTAVATLDSNRNNYDINSSNFNSYRDPQ